MGENVITWSPAGCTILWWWNVTRWQMIGTHTHTQELCKSEQLCRWGLLLGTRCCMALMSWKSDCQLLSNNLCHVVMLLRTSNKEQYILSSVCRWPAGATDFYCSLLFQISYSRHNDSVFLQPRCCILTDNTAWRASVFFVSILLIVH